MPRVRDSQGVRWSVRRRWLPWRPRRKMPDGWDLGGASFDGDDVVSRRLCDLGFAPGESVVRLRRAPLGGPVMFRVGGVEIVLRSAEARRVVVAA